MPQTEYPKKPDIRFCGDCGYELAIDNDGRCPMCPRLEQLRLNLAVPRPSDLREQRANARATYRNARATYRNARATYRSAAQDEWRPTVAEYRALLAERRAESTDESRARVIRTLGRRQTPLPHPPNAAHAADDEALEPPEEIQPPGRSSIDPRSSPRMTKKRRRPPRTSRTRKSN